MGTYQKGILGGFSGTVGNVVGGSWKGIDYMRSKGNRRTTTTSQKQKEQQAKFAVIARFQQPLSGLLAVSFKSFAVRMTGANSAMSYNLRNGISGVYPDYTIDFSNILVSRGDMPNATNPAAAAGTAGIVTFSWTNNAGSGKAKDTDKAIMVAYCEELQQSVYTDAGPDRSEGTANFALAAFSGKQVQTWLGFISEDGKLVATSAFTGAINVV